MSSHITGRDGGRVLFVSDQIENYFSLSAGNAGAEGINLGQPTSYREAIGTSKSGLCLARTRIMLLRFVVNKKNIAPVLENDSNRKVRFQNIPDTRSYRYISGNFHSLIFGKNLHRISLLDNMDFTFYVCGTIFSLTIID